MEWYESYKQCEQRLNQLTESFRKETQRMGEILFQLKSELMKADTEIAMREKNVFQMEVSIRKQMEAGLNLQKQLKDAVQKENAGILRQQLLQEELDTETEKNKKLEERTEEMAKQIYSLEKKVSELSMMNQKLSNDKMTLLQAQLKGGGNE